MATIKEFSKGKIGVEVFIKVNHKDTSFVNRLANYYPYGYRDEPNGTSMLAWIRIKPDVPVKIPCADVTISSQFKEQRQTTIAKRKTPDYQNHFTVTITKGTASESFDYHASINDADKGIVNLSDNDKIGAFYCFVQDAISGTLPFKEFKSEYGYDDCCEAHRIWKLCQESTIKATRLGLGDLYALSERIQNEYPEVV